LTKCDNFKHLFELSFNQFGDGSVKLCLAQYVVAVSINHMLARSDEILELLVHGRQSGFFLGLVVKIACVERLGIVGIFVAVEVFESLSPDHVGSCHGLSSPSCF